MAIRYGVAHAHTLYEKSKTEFCSVRIDVVLNLQLRPWIGDLMSEPYGGVTSGVEKAICAEDTATKKERRTDRLSSVIVERAVYAGQLYGKQAATDLMRESFMPEHTILRVTSCAAFRRKGGRAPRSAIDWN